jgi:FAD/FMN-containing dehydrogenase
LPIVYLLRKIAQERDARARPIAVWNSRMLRERPAQHSETADDILKRIMKPNDDSHTRIAKRELMFVTTTAGPKPVVEAARPALEAIWGRLAPHVNGAYANFLASATEEDVAAIYPTETYKRLAAVKRQYDPGNLFVRNHNVRPQ